MSSAPRKDQFAGCLVGQCLGDALGFPVEGYVAEVCRQYVLGMLRTGRAGQVGRPPFPFGQYTDDSQLARELLITFRELGRFDPEAYASRIAALFVADKVVGQGRTTEDAARRLAAGVPWEDAGAPPPAAGNGSAMRAAPVGLIFWDDPGELIAAAVDQGRISHRDSRCAAGSVAVAGAVALALREGPVDAAGFLARLREWTAPVDVSFCDALASLEEWLELSPVEAAARIGAAGMNDPPEKGWKGITPFVTASVLWSLFSFLRTPDDYWDTVCTAISAGGDTDTTAAMAGAMSGARLGREGLPPILANRLTDRGAWGLDELVALAEDCHGIVVSGSGGGEDQPS